MPSANPRWSETKLIDSTWNPAAGPALPAAVGCVVGGAAEDGAEAAVAGCELDDEPDGDETGLAG